MGFLDKMVDFRFKTSQDGHKLYFPGWPFTGRIIPSEAEYQKLRQQVKISCIGQFIYIIVVVARLQQPICYIVIFFGIVPVIIWNYITCRHLERSDEQSPDDEVIAKIARDRNTFSLWIMKIVDIAFVIAGIVMLIIKWRHLDGLLISIFLIVLFGWCAIRGAKILKVKSRQGSKIIS